MKDAPINLPPLPLALTHLSEGEKRWCREWADAAVLEDRAGREEESDAVEGAWNAFNRAIGDGPDAPYPGMAQAFEKHFAQSFSDKDWRNEASTWAAAWKIATDRAAPNAQEE